jgi:hypothetical protein
MLDVPFSAEDREGMKACAGLDHPWPCLAATAKARGVDRIVVVRLERYPKGFILTERVLVRDDGNAPATDRKICEECGDAELVAATTELTRSLLERAAAHRTAPQDQQGHGAGAHVDTGDGERRSRLVPGIVTVVGALAAVGGGVLQVTKDSPGPGPQAEYLYSAPGIGLMIGGGVAIGVGVFLWVRASRSPRSTPTAAITHGGGLVGWTGRF